MKLKLYRGATENVINHLVGLPILTDAKGNPIVSPPMAPAKRAEANYLTDNPIDVVPDGKIILRGTGFQYQSGLYKGTLTAITVLDLDGNKIYELTGLKVSLNAYVIASTEANSTNPALTEFLERNGNIDVEVMPFKGTNGVDDFALGDGDNRLEALGGNDNITAGAGDDRIDGGTGNDRLFGEDGQDVLNGDDGNDGLSGGADDDKLSGGNGNDTLVGDAGNDELRGGKGDDVLVGGTENDRLKGDQGNDTLRGEAGNDSLDGGTGNDTIGGEEGNDLLVGGAGNDLLEGGNGLDTMEGGAGDDWIACDGAGVGDGVPDQLVFRANSGNDIVQYWDDADTIRFVNSPVDAFGDLTIVQQAEDTVITFTGGRITLLAVNAATIEATDFLFG